MRRAASPFAIPSAIKLHGPRPRRESRRRRRKRRFSRRVAGYLLGSICEIRDLFVRAKDGNRSREAKVTRHNGDASISLPFYLPRTLQKPSFILFFLTSRVSSGLFSFPSFPIYVRFITEKELPGCIDIRKLWGMH